MARPRADFPPAEAIRALVDDQGRLALRVTPGARTESMAVDGDCLAIKVRTKPEDGKANERVIELLADGLGLPKSRLKLLRGATGRDKLVAIA